MSADIRAPEFSPKQSGIQGSHNGYPSVIIIICDIYIAPYSARSCFKTLYNIIYNIIIPDSDLFPLSTYLNFQRSIQCMLPLLAQSINQTHSHHILSGTHFFYGWVNPWLFDYESYARTNCTITAYYRIISLCLWYRVYFVIINRGFGVTCINFTHLSNINSEWTDFI